MTFNVKGRVYVKEKFKKMMEDDSAYRDMKEKQAKRREHSEKGVNAYTVFLSIMCLAISILFFVYKDLWFGLGFLGLTVLLGAMAFFSYRAERKADKENKSDNPKDKEE